MITFSAVTKQFGSNPPALEDVSFDVEKGEFIFLTGHSGSGKSTLLKIITREYRPSSGEITFEDMPLSQIRGGRIHHHRRKIGVVFQDYRLLPELNIWENIALPLQITGRPQSEIEERVTDLLELVQLIDKAHAFPAELSGGESQRVGIARALSTAPSLVLADEPTGNLDPQNSMIIARLFDKIHQLGTTIIFATHDAAILRSLPHRRIHLEKGRIVSEEKIGTSVEKKPSSPTPVTTVSQLTTETPAEELEKADVPQHIGTKQSSPEQLIEEDDEQSPQESRSQLFRLPKLKLRLPFGRKKRNQNNNHSHQDEEKIDDQEDDNSENTKITVQVEEL